MKKLYVILIVVIGAVVAGAFIGIKMYNKVPVSTTDLKADLSIDVAKITADFKADTSKARRTYQNKIIVLSGTVDKIEKDQLGHMNLFFVANDVNIQCTMDTTKNASEGVADKKPVKLKCQYSGYEPADIDPMPIIKFKECVVEK